MAVSKRCYLNFLVPLCNRKEIFLLLFFHSLFSIIRILLAITEKIYYKEIGKNEIDCFLLLSSKKELGIFAQNLISPKLPVTILLRPNLKDEKQTLLHLEHEIFSISS